VAIEVGSEVGDYRIEGVLGRGGMGVVFEARQLALDRTVALKVLSPELSLDESFRERFRREGLIQAQIDHPHIVPVYSAGEHDGALYLAMRLVRGPTLKELVAARELEAARTLRILTPVADALDAANEVGLIHRDVKPQNILVGSRDHAFLADFGLTKGPTEQRSLTRTGQFVGTLDYISPEQIRGESATAASDVYALGAVLYECLTGVVPFPKQSDAAVLYAHMSEDPPLVTEQRPDLPQALDDVLVRAMAKNPSDRHENATLLLREAEHAFGRRIRAAITPPVPVEIPEEAGIRRREEDVTTLETRVRRAVEPPPAPQARASPEGRESAEQDAPSDRDRAPVSGSATAASGVHAPPPMHDTPAIEDEPTPAGADDSSRVDRSRVGLATDPHAVAPRPASRADDGLDRVPEDSDQGPAAPYERRKPAADPAVAARRGQRTRPPAQSPPPAVADAPAQRRRPNAAVLAAVGALAALAVIAVGYVAGHSGGPGKAPPQSAASTTDVQLRYAAPWTVARRTMRIPGLALTHRADLDATKDAGLAVGRIAGEGPTLLPAAFLRRLQRTPARDDRVRLGALSAYRYAGLRPKGFGRPLTLYVAPTTTGVTAIACYGPRGGRDVPPDCEHVANSVKLARGAARPLGPDPAYAKRLDAVIRRLNAGRARGMRRLRTARTRLAQAAAASALARAYADAGARVRRLPPGADARPAHRELGRALADGRAAFTRLAGAATRGRTRRYGAARRAASGADREIRRALQDLRASGYVVRR